MRKLKQSITSSKQSSIQFRQKNYWLYHLEMLVSMNFSMVNAFYQKDLLGKAATIKRFEYSPLSKELKKQTIVAEKWYQSFDKVFMHNEKEKPVKTSVNTSVKQQIQF